MRELAWIFLANHMPCTQLGSRLRRLMLRAAGVRIEGQVCLFGPVTIRPLGGAKLVSIGRGSFLNTGVRFGARGGVTIGAWAQVGPNVMFETVSHDLQFRPGALRPDIVRPILVEDNVWIGAGAIILGGVTIGRGAVVAAGAVVRTDVAPGTLVAGVPARPVKSIPVIG